MDIKNIINKLSLKNACITREELISIKCSKKILKILLTNGFIEKVNDKYVVKNKNLVYFYIKELIENNKVNALFVLKNILEENPYDVDMLLELIILYIDLNNYDDALKVVSFLMKNDTNDNNYSWYLLYVYLLDKLTTIPENFKRELVFIEDDIKFIVRDESVNSILEDMLFNVFDYRYKPAIKSINILKGTDRFAFVAYILLSKIVTNKENFEYEVKEYLNSKNYSALSKLLNGREKERFGYYAVSYLANVLFSLENNEDIPNRDYEYTAFNYLEQLIFTNNFYEAKGMLEYSDFQGPLYDVAYYLLCEICSVLDKQDENSKKY